MRPYARAVYVRDGYHVSQGEVICPDGNREAIWTPEEGPRDLDHSELVY